MPKIRRPIGTGMTKRGTVTFDWDNPADVEVQVEAAIDAFEQSSFERLSRRIMDGRRTHCAARRCSKAPGEATPKSMAAKRPRRGVAPPMSARSRQSGRRGSPRWKPMRRWPANSTSTRGPYSGRSPALDSELFDSLATVESLIVYPWSGSEAARGPRPGGGSRMGMAPIRIDRMDRERDEH